MASPNPFADLTDPFQAFEDLARANTKEFCRRSLPPANAARAGACDLRPNADYECHPNSSVPSAEPVTVFHTQLPVSLSLRRLAHVLASRTGGDALDALLGLLVAIAYCERNRVAITEAMSARLFVGAYRVATKAMSDTVVSAADFASMAGIGPWEATRLELTVLRGIDWCVHGAIGRPAGDWGTASLAMLEDAAIDRISELPRADDDARARRERIAAARPCPSLSVSDDHPGGVPESSSAAADLPPSAVSGASVYHPVDDDDDD